MVASKPCAIHTLPNGAKFHAVVNASRDPLYRLERLGTLASMKPHPKALPNVENAVIPVEKLVGYALNPDHPKGSDKARVFASALGYTRENAQELIRQLSSKLATLPALERPQTPYGRSFSVDVPISGPGGSAVVVTGWLLDIGEKAPKLTSLRVAKVVKNAQ
jgi:hypothetical protein